MNDIITQILDQILGLYTPLDQISFWQMGLRAALIYVAAIVMVRLGGDRRFVGKHAAIDVLLTVIMGSTLSRAINGPAPYFTSLVAVAVLVVLHIVFAVLSYHSRRFDKRLKARSQVLIESGEIHPKNLEDAYISGAELRAALRLRGKTEDPSQIQTARLENNGRISVIPKAQEPQIIKVKVEPGVQTVRIQLD
jgi:uncharacterized membrane protein YcaP (DUF421 family)